MLVAERHEQVADRRWQWLRGSKRVVVGHTFAFSGDGIDDRTGDGLGPSRPLLTAWPAAQSQLSDWQQSGVALLLPTQSIYVAGGDNARIDNCWRFGCSGYRPAA